LGQCDQSLLDRLLVIGQERTELHLYTAQCSDGGLEQFLEQGDIEMRGTGVFFRDDLGAPLERGEVATRAERTAQKSMAFRSGHGGFDVLECVGQFSKSYRHRVGMVSTS